MSSLLNISAFLQAGEGGEAPLAAGCPSPGAPASRRRPPGLQPIPALTPGRGAGAQGGRLSLSPARPGRVRRAWPLPLPQRGMEGLPVGALQVVVVEVLELGRRGRLGALLELQGVLLAVGSGGGGGGGVAVCNVSVGAGRVKFCSHLLLQGQGHYLIASWHLAV